MTSIALLAHSARAAAPAFNGLYYATAATIIPVLFLAIAVQGTAYQTIMNTVYAASARQASAAGGRKIGFIAFQPFFTMLAYAIILAGIAGETFSIIALQQQATFAGASELVFLAMMLLIAIAALGPSAPTSVSRKLPPAPGPPARRGRPSGPGTRRTRHTGCRNGQNGRL